MKQIIQDLKSGDTILEDVPAPKVSNGHVLIQTTRTLVSLGTERMLVEFGKANLISKARQQPDKVKMVLDKIKSDGLMPTLEAVFKKLEQPLPLGYCHVGKVVDIGKGVNELKVGDRVVSNGQHAEFVCVPKNLVAKIPDEVSDDEAAFTVIGSIGLQGIRLLQPNFGETVVVLGLGLIGLITAELLLANGCQVIGIDLDDQKLKLAQAKGIVTINPRSGADVVKFVTDFTNGVGADGVIVTASAKTDEIISQAARMSRQRGRIVLVGVVGLNLNRAEFYQKELSFQVSCSYGPGRYDPDYEEKGNDYPIGFVRWTEKRNFEAILNALANKRLNVQPLITEVVELVDYEKIYGNIGRSDSIASIIAYPENSVLSHSVEVNARSFNNVKGVLGIVGAGNFTKMTMLPLLAKSKVQLKYICSARGVSGTVLAKKYGIAKSTTDYQEMLDDNEVGMVVITTRHNLHAPMVVAALNAGKHVFVEKPLALNHTELDEIVKAYKKSNKTLTVGFNRRFSPHALKIKPVLDPKAPKNIIATMNAGFIPPEVWVHDMEIGGGRLIGEACHFIDLISFFTGSRVVAVCANAMGKNPNENSDNASILLKYENGDNGIINYFANGNKAYAKERVEIYCQGKNIIMDNFRTTDGFGISGFSRLKTKQDKGHKNQFDLLAKRTVEDGDALIPFEDIVNTTRASFAIIESLKKMDWVKVEH